jgi:hypothetical protein
MKRMRRRRYGCVSKQLQRIVEVAVGMWLRRRGGGERGSSHAEFEFAFGKQRSV